MFHFRAVKLLPDYLAGRLPVSKRPALAGHLQLCPVCRERATEILGNLRPSGGGGEGGSKNSQAAKA